MGRRLFDALFLAAKNLTSSTNRHKTRAAIDARGMCIYILHCIPALPCVMCGGNVGVSIFSVGFWFARFWRYGMSEPLAAERAHLQQPTPFFLCVAE